MNHARAAHGLRPLRYDAKLEQAARSHSAEMVRTGAFSHGNFGRRMSSFRVRGPYMGENLAWGVGSFATAGQIVAEWLASPAHRANLLRGGFRRAGVGAAFGNFQGYAGATVVTADFGGR